MNFYNIKLKAGALQYTIFISVVIALLVFAFIGLTYIQGKLRIKGLFFQEVVHAVNQSFDYLAVHKIPNNEQAVILASAENKIETTANKSHWGIFDITTITSTKGKETFTKTALLGGFQQQKTGLYLQNTNQPLVLVGNTRIEGNTYLPEQGVKRGTIAGHSYMGQQLIYGSISQSNDRLPKILNANYLKTIANEILSKESNVFIELEENTRLVNSFSEATKIISSNTSIDLRFVALTGNIVIHSTIKIKVYPSAKLKDVILIAPQIEILDKVSGNFQGLATKKITVGKKCELIYPTALVLIEKEKAIKQNNNEEINQIIIHKNTELKGIIAFITKDRTDNYKPQIVLEENTVITGEVYCNQNIELKGTVKGSIYTKGFIANQFGSVYKNHIYNGKILNSDLPQQYCGLSLKNTQQKVAKWLYY
ncbi:MAG: hypothetical protein L3J20_01740 [Flavobacteriaceae bacterium]|nr:hypothetical protein [Flavobacteriaceae bacterium]